MPALTSAFIIGRFNTIVRSAAPSLNSAPWHAGAIPGQNTTDLVAWASVELTDYGSQSENPARTAADIDLAAQGVYTSSAVFSVLHRFAMELTRVRRVRAVRFTNNSGAANLDQAYNTAALQPRLALSFPMPATPAVGTVITSSDLDTFLNALSVEVNARRSNDAYKHTIATCHSNCHGSCHGSRGRR